MRVAGRDEIVAYANALLEVERWPEFAPPGMQVVGSDDVTLLLCGVSSSRALFEHAADVDADMVLVHHGIFWRNEPLVVDRRQRGRLEALFRANASLVAYPLALDAHETLGAPFDAIDVVVGELSPLLLHRTLELKPLAFENVGVHWSLPQTLYGRGSLDRESMTC